LLQKKYQLIRLLFKCVSNDKCSAGFKFAVLTPMPILKISAILRALYAALVVFVNAVHHLHETMKHPRSSRFEMF
jgi:hypothetical protein